MNGTKAQKPWATPSVNKARSVEVSAPPTTKIHDGVLTSSQPAGIGSMDAHSVQRIKPHSPTPSVRDTCDVVTACHVAQQELMEGLLDLRFERNQKREGEQVGVVKKIEGAEKEHKKGKLEAVSDGAVEGKFTYAGEVARECQLEKEVGGNGLGFSTHTPIVNKTKCGTAHKHYFPPSTATSNVTLKQGGIKAKNSGLSKGTKFVSEHTSTANFRK